MAAPTNPELEANILAHPDDREAYLVYADWLQSHGDPRGELVAVQTKLTQGANPALSAREQELFAAHAGEWLGELAKFSPKDLAITWAFKLVKTGPDRAADRRV